MGYSVRGLLGRGSLIDGNVDINQGDMCRDLLTQNNQENL